MKYHEKRILEGTPSFHGYKFRKHKLRTKNFRNEQSFTSLIEMVIIINMSKMDFLISP